MTAKILPVLFLVLFASGCRKPSPTTQYVCLLDISASIYPDAVSDEFDAIGKLADRLHRGDSLVIIPISGNARNHVQGHILRLEVPDQRMAYDTDLAAFRDAAHRQITDMKSWAISHPSLHTDILGTLQVAQQELPTTPAVKSQLVILSDFLEDDGKWNFATDPEMTSAIHARFLSKHINLHVDTSFDSVYLGLIPGRESQTLSSAHLEAVDAFWCSLFTMNSRPTPVHIDGTEAMVP